MVVAIYCKCKGQRFYERTSNCGDITWCQNCEQEMIRNTLSKFGEPMVTMIEEEYKRLLS